MVDSGADFKVLGTEPSAKLLRTDRGGRFSLWVRDPVIWTRLFILEAFTESGSFCCDGIGIVPCSPINGAVLHIPYPSRIYFRDF